MKINYLISLTFVAILAFKTQAGTLEVNLMQCAGMKDTKARLICFDGLAEKVEMQNNHLSQSNNKIIAKATLATNKPEKLVNSAKTKAEKFGAEHLKSKKVKEDLQVIFTIAEINKDLYGKWRITFNNEQLWKQTDSASLNLKLGDSVLLKKGFMNAVYLQKNESNSNRKIRVKRLK